MTVDIFQGQDYNRKQFPVQAVQVTHLNMAELAEACGGEIKHDGDKEGNFSRDYIEVPVRKPQNKRQTQAYITDVIVKQGRTFKVYPEKSFHQQFESKNGAITPKAKPNKSKHYGKGPNPANMPKKRTAGTPDPKPRVITEGELVGLSLDDKPNAFGGTVELVEGTKTSPQEAPREDLGGLDIPKPATQADVIDTKIEEGKLPLAEPGTETPEEIAYNDMAGREIIEQEEAEIQANVDAQLAQSPVEAQSMGAFVNGDPADHTVEGEIATPKVKPITLDQLNTQAGDTRTAQEIMAENNKS